MEARLAVLESRLGILEQSGERACADNAGRGADLDRHTLSLTVHELASSMQHVEKNLANVLTHRDLLSNNERLEKDLHKHLGDVSAESRREMIASMQDSFRGAKDLMQSHDAALARRAQAHIDTLTVRSDAQSRAVEAISQRDG